MKNLTKLILLLLFYNYNLQAQTKTDSVSMLSSYSNQVFYSLENGIIKSENATNWDIAFAVSGNGAAGSAILLNETNAILWAYPGDTSKWNTFDTTNYNAWERLLNTDTSWTNGAFNVYRGANGMFDMGWGVLNPQNNYWTFGDSLYLIRLADNSFKKLWIVSLKSGVWEFKYANVDGSNEQTITFNKNNYPNKNFVYFSMINNQLIDREPDNTTWELTFVKHTDYISYANQYVGVTSIFSNVNVWSAKGHYTDFATANTATTPQTPFNQNINNIGREWKNYSSANGWEVYDTIAYFVYNLDSTKMFRIVFTGFGGSANGKIFFTKAQINENGIDEHSLNESVRVFPNPIVENVFINSEKPKNCHLEIYNIQGESVFIQNFYQTTTIDMKRFSSGIYTLKIISDNSLFTEKIIKL